MKYFGMITGTHIYSFFIQKNNYGGLNGNSPYRGMYLNAWTPVGDWRDLVERRVSQEMGFEHLKTGTLSNCSLGFVLVVWVLSSWVATVATVSATCCLITAIEKELVQQPLVT